MAPHHSCSIRLVFKPSQPTLEIATLTLIDNGANSPQTVTLTGTGTPTALVVFPVLVNFGSVAVNSTATAPVTLVNPGNQALTVQQIATTKTVYAQTNNCGTSVAPGLRCTISVTFTPVQKGSVQAGLTMALNGKKAQVESKLTGSGQ